MDGIFKFFATFTLIFVEDDARALEFKVHTKHANRISGRLEKILGVWPSFEEKATTNEDGDSKRVCHW